MRTAFDAKACLGHGLRSRMAAQLFGLFLGDGKRLPLNLMVLTEPDVFNSLIKTIGPGGDFAGLGQQYYCCRWFTQLASGQLTLTGFAPEINHITHGESDAASRVNATFPKA